MGSSVSEYFSALSYILRELEVFIHFFEKSVPAYQTTQHHIPEEHKLYTQHCEKPKSHTRNYVRKEIDPSNIRAKVSAFREHY
jgi:hypothetical protein